MTVISSRPPGSGASLARGAPPLESSGLLEGERLGQFLLQKFIGGGGMGVVFRALDTTLNREVAVKVLSRDQSADEEALRRFRNEAQSAARLNHENIARVHYVGEDRGVHYIVFEFIEGVNLRDRVEQSGPLPLAEAVSYTFQIAQALDHASQRDVIHRDIKPSNVLITPDGKAKLVDMGLARLNQVAQADADLTASGVTLGTFDYISPEQARDPRSADVRSDLYSLGCSFFYMLTGRPPFPDGTVLQKLLQHQADHPPDPRSVRPELPVEVTWILARLLAKNPAQRFQQPAELTEHLAALGEKLGIHLSASAAAVPRPRLDGPLARWQRHLPWVVPLAALFLIVMALDYSWSSNQQEGELAIAPLPAREPATTPALPKTHAAAPSADSPQPRTVQGTVKDDSPAAPVVEPDARRGTDKSNDPAAPQAAAAPAPLLERVIQSLGAELNIDQLKAQAAAAAGTESQVGPPPQASGASGAATSPDGPSAQPPATAPRDGLLIVSDSDRDTGAHVFSSLRAACNNAKSGDTIELRFNRRMLEEPITILNMKLTIRAGDGYRPVVGFRPEPNPVKFPPSMLSVIGGQLTASNIHFELDVPRELPGDWALVETRRAELLQFEKCSFTIRNRSLGQSAFHEGVTFFDIKAPFGAGGMAMDPSATDEHVVKIELKDCVARGEAALVRDNDLQAVRLDWDNGLLATSERLLVAAGGSTEPRQMRSVQITLRHVTAVLHGGLALLTDSDDAPYQLFTEINCTDTILASTNAPPLVEQRGADTVEEYLARVKWNGEHDFFDGFDVFWRISNGTTQAGAKQMSFSEWQQFWASRSKSMNNVPLAWKNLPRSDRPFHAQAPDDYALDATATTNPALRGASDGLDAGCIANQLSVLPPEESRPIDERQRSDRAR
jgi:serine/threonine-protein kinase